MRKYSIICFVGDKSYFLMKKDFEANTIHNHQLKVCRAAVSNWMVKTDHRDI